MHPVTRKLSIFADFTSEEAAALALVMSGQTKLAAHQDIARQDDPPGNMFFLLEGIAMRHKMLPTGKRQILSFLLAGDGCDLAVSLLERRDHSITAMTECVVATVSDKALEHVMLQYPKLRAAMQWSFLSEESIAREWIVNVGVRDAPGAMAHLFCEMFHRSTAIGTAHGMGCAFPGTQSDLGEALGISAVHVNRCLQQLRSRKLIAFGGNQLTVLNLKGLEDQAGFDPVYLHLGARYEASSRLA